MDKQREDFEKAFKENLGAHGCQFDLDDDGNYEDRETLCGWFMWQAAQKVVVADGYKLVSLKDLNSVYDELANTHNPNYPLVFDLLNRMIEAQEDST